MKNNIFKVLIICALLTISSLLCILGGCVKTTENIKDDASIFTSKEIDISTSNEVNIKTSNDIYRKILELERGNTKKGSIGIISKSNDKAASEIITQVYDLEEIEMRKGIASGVAATSLNSVDPSLYSFNTLFPIECIRQIDDNNLYVVYKTEDDKGNIIYLYCFFEATFYTITDKIENYEVENWSLKNSVLYSMNNISSVDFGNIKIGSTLADVEKIDPTVYKYIPIDYSGYEGYEENLEKAREELGQDFDPLKRFASKHLLSDGILHIGYEKNDAGEYIIIDIKLSGNYQIGKQILIVDNKDLPNKK